MATLCEVAVFSVSVNSWKISGLRIFRGSVVKSSVEGSRKVLGESSLYDC
jgi:hypothetical protein